MSELPHWQPTTAAPPTHSVAAPSGSWWRAVLAWAVVVVAGGVAGWCGGRLWWRWWGPGPDGRVLETTDGLVWYPDPIGPGVARFFPATGEFMVIGFGLGILLGLLAGAACRGREVVSLVVGLGAAGLAAWAMYATGVGLSPPDPQTLAEAAGAGAELPGAIGIEGWTPYLAWPAGMLLGFALVVVLVPPRRRATR